MGARHTVTANGLIYTMVDDPEFVYQVCITGSLNDESAGSALGVQAAIEADRPGLNVKVLPCGLYALSGYAAEVFPDLAVTAYTVHLTVTAPRYRTQVVTVNLPAGTTLPVVVPPVKLRGAPVRLQGRVVKDSDRTPIAGAMVTSVNANRLTLSTPAYFGHASALSVETATLTPAGPARSLVSTAAGGGATVVLNNNAGLPGGTVLQFSTGADAEIAVVASTGAAGAVTLTAPLNSTHAAGTAVREAAVAPGGSAALTRDVDAGDGLLQVAAVVAGPVVRVVDGVKTEYHRLGAQTDAAGYFHWNGVAGVSALDMQASAGGLSNLTQSWTVDYDSAVNVMNFRMKP